jgi:hypothetical protein
MNRRENEAEILDALGRLIGQNADWLSGRDFQRLANQAAGAYFEAGDLDTWPASGAADDPDRVLSPTEVPGRLADALRRELGLEGTPHG